MDWRRYIVESFSCMLLHLPCPIFLHNFFPSIFRTWKLLKRCVTILWWRLHVFLIRKSLFPETLKNRNILMIILFMQMERRWLFSHGWPPRFAPHLFSIGLAKTESGFIVRSIETSLERWTLVVAVINVDAYPFLPFSELTCHLEDTRIGFSWLHSAAW